jgi:hypothetical protein
MFSKIGEILGPFIVRKAGDSKERRDKDRQPGKKEDSGAGEQKDATFLSTQVLRLMLAQEDPASPKTARALAKLDALERRGIREVAVLPEQSVLSALEGVPD